MMTTALLFLALLPHKFHASLTEIEHNPETGKLEIVLRLFTDDLEQALGLRLGRKIVLDGEKNIGPAVLTYMQDVLKLKDSDGNLLSLSWVGIELEVLHTYVYLQADAPQSLEDMQVSMRIFAELFSDQDNTVNLKQAAERASLSFKSNQHFKTVHLSK